MTDAHILCVFFILLELKHKGFFYTFFDKWSFSLVVESHPSYLTYLPIEPRAPNPDSKSKPLWMLSLIWGWMDDEYMVLGNGGL